MHQLSEIRSMYLPREWYGTSTCSRRKDFFSNFTELIKPKKNPIDVTFSLSSPPFPFLPIHVTSLTKLKLKIQALCCDCRKFVLHINRWKAFSDCRVPSRWREENLLQVSQLEVINPLGTHHRMPTRCFSEQLFADCRCFVAFFFFFYKY